MKNNGCFSILTNSDFIPDSPISYRVEEGEISSGQTSPADTVVDTSTQTMDTGVQAGSPAQSPTPEPWSAKEHNRSN